MLLIPALLAVFSSVSAQKLIRLSSLNGGNLDNVIDVPPPFAVFVSAHSDTSEKLKQIFVKSQDNMIASLDMLRHRKQTSGSGLLQPWPLNSTTVVTTVLSNEQLASMTGFIYVISTKQLNSRSFFVYDVDQSQKISIERNVLGDSTIVFLNSNQQVSPPQSSTISAWLQTQDSRVQMYRGIPTDDTELPSSQIFSNPVTDVSGSLQFVPTVEKFSLTIPTFYMRTHMDIQFVIEPSYFDIDGTGTSSYHSTGFYMKSTSEAARKVTVLCVRDTRFDGTTAANIVGHLPSATGKVTVQVNDVLVDNSVSVSPKDQIQGWRTSGIGKNISIFPTDATDGEYYVQYIVTQGQQISSTMAPGDQTTVYPQTTTKDSQSSHHLLSLLVIFCTVLW